MRHPIRANKLLLVTISMVLWLQACTVAAADGYGRFDQGGLSKTASCIGGVWAAQEKQQDSLGRDFIPIRECQWAANGTAISFKQDLLYADGAIRPGLEGLNVWDPSLNTVRAFGVFAHGGIIYDATYKAETLSSKTQIMEFKFVSPTSGAVSQWQSVETHINGNTFTEEGLMLVDKQWKSMSLVTFHRLARIDGAGTFHELVARNRANLKGLPIRKSEKSK